MGRKSLAKERTEEILNAFEACIVEYGLSGATLQRVADHAGIKLSMIDHYIGNREALVSAMVERFIMIYEEDTDAFLSSLPETNRLEQLLDFYMSDTGIFYRSKDTAILAELIALGDRDTAVKQQVLDLYRSLDESFYTEVRRTVKSATEAQCRQVAYLLLTLWVGHATLRWQGFEVERHIWVRETAEMLVQGISN